MILIIQILDFPLSQKDYRKIGQKYSICTNVFSYENDWFILFMCQIKKLKNAWIYCR